MDPIKKQPVHTFASLGKGKTKVSIIEDEGHSYRALLAEFDKKKIEMYACHNGLAHYKQTVVHMLIVIKVTVPFPSTIKFLSTNRHRLLHS